MTIGFGAHFNTIRYFGALAGILRMLVQSDFNDDGTVTVKLLPALPTEPEWQQGSVKGLRIKGVKDEIEVLEKERDERINLCDQ